MITLYKDNDNTLFWKNMDQASDGSWVTGATVTATLYNNATGSAVAVTGATGISLTYVSGSNATYVGYIPSTASLVVGDDQTLVFTATYSGHTAVINEPAQVVTRVS